MDGTYELVKRQADFIFSQLKDKSLDLFNLYKHEQLADQLLLPLAFSPIGSQYTFDKMYPHVKTNLEVINIIMGDILSLEKLGENLHKLTRK